MKHNGERHGGNGARRPDEILAEIERTRHEMDSTLTQIEHRLTPGQLIDQGLDYLRNSGGSEMVSNLGTQVKNNPLPVTLVGIGLAWLMASSKNPPAQRPAHYTSYMDEASARASLGDRAHEATDSAKQKLGEAAQGVRDRISGVGDRMGQVSRSARDSASHLGESARQQIERARGGVDYMVREQPLALGALGVAVGALFAALAPRTRKEDELMGETRDRLLDQAKEVGKEKLEQAKEVAKSVAETATKEAEEKGLTAKPSPASVSEAQPRSGGQLQGSKPGQQQQQSKPGGQQQQPQQSKPGGQQQQQQQSKPGGGQSPVATIPPATGSSGGPRRTS